MDLDFVCLMGIKLQNHIILDITSKRKIDRSYKHFIPQCAELQTLTMVKTSIYDVNTECAYEVPAVILRASQDNAL